MKQRRVVRHEVIQPLDQSIKLIPLTQGQTAIVSAHRYKHLSQWSWYAVWMPLLGGFYAARKGKDFEGRKRIIYMHRYILDIPPGDPREGDHVCPGETLNNTDDNLRIATRAQKARNQRIRKRNKSGFKGIFHRKGCINRWSAKVVHNRIPYNLGTFSSPQAAHEAYCKKLEELHGEFARFE